MTEQELVERCREGDREAQRELYERTSAHIYRLLLKMTANPDDAIDLAQDTYVKAFARIRQFDGRSSIATWLYRVAVNEALQFFRRNRRMQLKLREVVADARRAIGGTTAALARGDSEIERSTLRLDVNGALDAVAPTERVMLLLRYQEGLDYRAIAEILGCPTGTVASRLNRARAALREILQKSYGQCEGIGPVEHPSSAEEVSAETGEARTKRGTGS